MKNTLLLPHLGVQAFRLSPLLCCYVFFINVPYHVEEFLFSVLNVLCYERVLDFVRYFIPVSVVIDVFSPVFFL